MQYPRTAPCRSAAQTLTVATMTSSVARTSSVGVCSTRCATPMERSRTIRRPRAKLIAFAIALSIAPLVSVAHAEEAQGGVPLLDVKVGKAIAGELSGSSAKKVAQAITLNHRMRGSEGYKVAAAVITEAMRQD